MIKQSGNSSPVHLVETQKMSERKWNLYFSFSCSFPHPLTCVTLLGRCVIEEGLQTDLKVKIILTSSISLENSLARHCFFYRSYSISVLGRPPYVNFSTWRNTYLALLVLSWCKASPLCMSKYLPKSYGDSIFNIHNLVWTLSETFCKYKSINYFHHFSPVQMLP